MRPLACGLAFFLAAAAAAPLPAQQKRVSPHETISAVIGSRATGTRVTLTYGRPYTADPKTGAPRKIWGELVPWDKAYRLGADEATLLVLQRPMVLGGTLVPAGAYTLYMVPSQAGPSKLAISTAIGKWGIPVDEGHDLARVDLKADTLPIPVDQLTLAIEKVPEGGAVLKISWETTQYSVALRQPAPHIDFPAASPAAVIKQRVGLTDIEVDFSRPSLKGRVMIGGIDPYGEVWRTGANSATTISFSTPVTFGGVPVDAGTYELFTIPGRDEWTVILQKPMHQWGAYTYDQKNDVLRVTSKPTLHTEPAETFTIGFGDLTDESATFYLVWDRVRVPVPIKVDVVGTVVPQIKAAMEGTGRKPYLNSALFYLDHNLDLKQAADWIDAAIAEKPDELFFFYYQKARVLAAMGDKAGAEAAARQSEDLAAKDTTSAKGEYFRLNEAVIAGLK
jgi:hypothetical protein